MKIAIGMNIQNGAWGGGNQFGRVLSEYLINEGHEVSFDLKDKSLDIILMTEPNRKLKTSAFNHIDILKYLIFKNSKAIVIHRINNTSEAKNESHKYFNKFRIHANAIADHTVFVSEWVRTVYFNSGFKSANSSVILNGGDQRLWGHKKALSKHSKFKIVTHHWSDNPNKGFDIYKRLDEMLPQQEWKDKIDVTYIGRKPKDFEYHSIHYESPKSGEALAQAIQSHDIYLTASQNESGPMHVIEGALCGLPLLYRASGALPEYCDGYGVSFGQYDFEKKLKQIIYEYDHWLKNVSKYKHTADRMCKNYLLLIDGLFKNKKAILKNRRHVDIMRMLLRQYHYSQ